MAKEENIMFTYEGKDKSGKIIKGDIKGPSESYVSVILKKQGLSDLKIKKMKKTIGKKIIPKDISLFTRQLATMLQAGIPLLQVFDIIAKSSDKPSVQKLLLTIKR